nr:THAP domain-containing protein 1-like [Hydra vulgaris]
MMLSCFAYNCTQRYIKRVSFHVFLKDIELRRKWIQVMWSDGFTPSKLSKRCGKYFTGIKEGAMSESTKQLYCRILQEKLKSATHQNYEALLQHKVSKLQISNTFETLRSEPESSSSQQSESMIVPSLNLALETTLPQPLPSESTPTTSSISICHKTSAPKSSQKSPCLQITFNTAVTQAIQKEIQKEVAKQLQSAQSLGSALQQRFRIQHVHTKKRKNVDVPIFKEECLNKPEILERLKDAESKKAAKQA